MIHADGAGLSFVSTGALPASDAVRTLVAEAHELYRYHDDGENSRVYPALERVPSHLFGLAVVGTDGTICAAGDAEVEFSIMSVSKPFVFALVCDAIGPEAAREQVGANATGMAFDSIDAIDQRGDGRTNPMVNPGAIATTSLVPGETVDARWQFIVDGLSRFAGRPLSIDHEIYASASATNHRNREIVAALQRHGRVAGDPSVALDLYTRQSSLRVTATDLAVMGSTLADGGVQPLTAIRVVDAVSCRCALAVMTTAGLYETSGDWLYDIGLPGKSGIGGGIVTVAPGKGGLGTFAPRLDGAGNSVKGQLAARHLSDRLGLDLLRSAPARRPADHPQPL
jgi:glutaminase